MSFSIYHDLIIRERPDKVFQAITDPEHLINWWPLECNGKAEVGNSYNFYFTHEYDWYGEVIQCQPDQTFHIKMTVANEDWNPTSFGFDLSDIDDNSTQVSFWHKNWPMCNAHFRRSSYCWAILLQGLKNYLERGTIVPFQERE